MTCILALCWAFIYASLFVYFRWLKRLYVISILRLTNTLITRWWHFSSFRVIKLSLNHSTRIAQPFSTFAIVSFEIWWLKEEIVSLPSCTYLCPQLCKTYHSSRYWKEGDLVKFFPCTIRTVHFCSLKSLPLKGDWLIVSRPLQRSIKTVSE